MKKERKPIRKVVNCPICHEEFDTRGLLGHIKIKHGKPRSEVKNLDKIIEKAEPKKSERAERVFELVDRLREIRKRKEDLEKEDQSGFFSTDETVKSLKDGLDDLEEEIKEELEDLGIIEEDIEEDEED